MNCSSFGSSTDIQCIWSSVATGQKRSRALLSFRSNCICCAKIGGEASKLSQIFPYAPLQGLAQCRWCQSISRFGDSAMGSGASMPRQSGQNRQNFGASLMVPREETFGSKILKSQRVTSLEVDDSVRVKARVMTRDSTKGAQRSTRVTSLDGEILGTSAVESPASHTSGQSPYSPVLCQSPLCETS